MKKLFFYSLAFALFSCNTMTESNQQKAEKATKEYLKKVLNDTKSYESISFTDLDTFYLSDGIKQEIEFAQFDLSIAKSALPLEYDTANTLDPLVSKYINAKATIDSLSALLLDKSVDTAILNVHFMHEYRAKNAMGALIKASDYVMLDRNLNVIKVLDK